MPIEFDPETGKLTYMGQEIGEHRFKDGKSTVQIAFEFETAGEWIEPISWLAYGLALLPENAPKPSLLTVETPEDSIDIEHDVVRLLTEKQVKRGNYVWKFHKTDADDWPSPLHGHDYEKGLKLDVLTGDIYDVATRQRCKAMKAKHLNNVRAELRGSKDFKELIVELVDNPGAGQTETE